MTIVWSSTEHDKRWNKERCYACDVLLIQVDQFHGDYRQFENALEVTFNGGYAEFIDVIDDPNPYNAYICHECAHDLCEKIPWINRLINPHKSHSHKAEYVEANPDHFGWDYDYRAENGK
jgi:hypothetical protein